MSEYPAFLIAVFAIISVAISYFFYVHENERLQTRIDELEEALCLRDSTMAEESKQFEALQGKVRELEVALAESRMNDRHAMSHWHEVKSKLAIATEALAEIKKEN